MATFRTLALGAALMAAAAGAVNAQTVPGGGRTDSAKSGDWRKGHEGMRHGEMGPGRRRGIKGGRHGGMGPGGRGLEFLHSLNLTETQRTQVRAIHEKYAPQMKAIHEQAMRETLAILTPDQRARADAKIAKRIKHLDGQKSHLEKLRR